MNTLVQSSKRETKSSETPTTMSLASTNTAMIIELPTIKKGNCPKHLSTNSLAFIKFIQPHQNINKWTVMWEFALDVHFKKIVNSIHIQQNIEQGQVIKVELINVPADIQVYQRLTCTDCMALELTQNDVEVSQHYTLPAQLSFPGQYDAFAHKQFSALQ